LYCDTDWNGEVMAGIIIASVSLSQRCTRGSEYTYDYGLWFL